MLNPTTNNQ